MNIINTIKEIRFKRPEWVLVIIFTMEVMFPQHTATAALSGLQETQTILTRPPAQIPYRDNEGRQAVVETSPSKPLAPDYLSAGAKARKEGQVGLAAVSESPVPATATVDVVAENKPGFTFEPKVKSVEYVTVTAFNSVPEQCDSTPFITGSGTYTRDGVVAANYLRVGTKVRFPDLFGDKVFVVEDRMNMRYYKRIDIWMEKKSDAKKFGIRKLKVEIVE